jgi:hypothetical protein
VLTLHGSSVSVVLAAGEHKDVPLSCASHITPACLQALYGILTPRANSLTNWLIVPGYIDFFPNKHDFSVTPRVYLEPLFASEASRTDVPAHSPPGLSTTFRNLYIDNGTHSQNLSQAAAELDVDT